MQSEIVSLPRRPRGPQKREKSLPMSLPLRASGRQRKQRSCRPVRKRLLALRLVNLHCIQCQNLYLTLPIGSEGGGSQGKRRDQQHSPRRGKQYS